MIPNLQKMKVIIIDDEARARNLLTELIKEYAPQLEVVTTADDVPNGVKAIHKYRPDLVFLDVEMPQYSGFQLLDFFEEVNFEIIFTTAYQEYALQAFQVSAIDYLLKPIQIDLLLRAIEKAQKINPAQNTERFQTLKANIAEEYIKRIALPVAGGLTFVEIDDIIYMQADGAYTHIVLKNKQKILVSKNIKSFEEMLTQPCFFRPHRSYIINLNHVRQFMKQDGGCIVMDDGETISISKEKREELLRLYNVP